jgi:HlyD family secretion protein
LRLKKLLLLACVAVSAWGVWYSFFRKPPATYELRTERVEMGDVAAAVTASGKLNAVSVVEVGTQVSGTILEILVDYNSSVKEGQLIARLDPSVLRSQLLEARAGLDVAEAGVGSAGASLVDSERKLKRNQELFARKLISRSELEDSETNVLLRQAQLQEAKARVTQAKAFAERARTNLDYAQITSPVDGVVVSRQVNVGQTVAASFQTPTLFSIAGDLTRMQIDASVDEADIGRVAEGQDVGFHVDAFPEELFSGEVVQVRIAPSTTDNVVTYTVVIHVDNSDLRLKPGMTANVSIKTDHRSGVLRLPASSLRFRPTQDVLNAMGVSSEDARPQSRPSTGTSLNSGSVWLTKDKKLLRRLFVTLGISDGSWVELVSGDLASGDELAVAAMAEGARRPRRIF